MKSANGVLILILGILAIISFGCLTGIPAWMLGNQSLKDLDSGMADPNERNLVVVGRILGIVGTILSIIVPCIILVFMTGIFGLAAAGAASQPR